MICETEPLVKKIAELYEKISSLESLKPSEDVNMVFSELVLTCIPPSPIDVSNQCTEVQEMRSKLIKLCGEAEGYLESHYSSILGSYDNPLHHLNIFPYFENYIKLSQIEFNILSQHMSSTVPAPRPKRIAFIGSGPLPFTSICLASFHLPGTCFHNYDIDPTANKLASALIKSDPDLCKRMYFHTSDIMDVEEEELKGYDVVFLAALVGMDEEVKCRVIEHLAKNMAPGAILMLRSAHGARAFLYPVVHPCDLAAGGFQMLSVFHPTDDVINSVVIARKFLFPCHDTTAAAEGSSSSSSICSFHHHHHHHQHDDDEGRPSPAVLLPTCKCSADDYQIFSRGAINHNNCCRIQELGN